MAAKPGGRQAFRRLRDSKGKIRAAYGGITNSGEPYVLLTIAGKTHALTPKQADNIGVQLLKQASYVKLLAAMYATPEKESK